MRAEAEGVPFSLNGFLPGSPFQDCSGAHEPDPKGNGSRSTKSRSRTGCVVVKTHEDFWLTSIDGPSYSVPVRFPQSG